MRKSWMILFTIGSMVLTSTADHSHHKKYELGKLTSGVLSYHKHDEKLADHPLRLLTGYETGNLQPANVSNAEEGEAEEGEEESESAHADSQQWTEVDRKAGEERADSQEGDDDHTGGDDDDNSSGSSSESAEGEAEGELGHKGRPPFISARPGSAIPGHLIPEIGPLPEPMPLYRAAAIMVPSRKINVCAAPCAKSPSQPNTNNYSARFASQPKNLYALSPQKVPRHPSQYPQSKSATLLAASLPAAPSLPAKPKPLHAVPRPPQPAQPPLPPVAPVGAPPLQPDSRPSQPTLPKAAVPSQIPQIHINFSIQKPAIAQHTSSSENHQKVPVDLSSKLTYPSQQKPLNNPPIHQGPPSAPLLSKPQRYAQQNQSHQQPSSIVMGEPAAKNNAAAARNSEVGGNSDETLSANSSVPAMGLSGRLTDNNKDHAIINPNHTGPKHGGSYQNERLISGLSSVPAVPPPVSPAKNVSIPKEPLNSLHYDNGGQIASLIASSQENYRLVASSRNFAIQNHNQIGTPYRAVNNGPYGARSVHGLYPNQMVNHRVMRKRSAGPESGQSEQKTAEEAQKARKTSHARRLSPRKTKHSRRNSKISRRAKKNNGSSVSRASSEK